MRTIVFTVAALLFSAPTLAIAQSAHVDLRYANTETDPGGGDFDAYSLSGQIALGGHFQIDGSYTQADIANGIDNYGVGAHVFQRNDTWLIGAYAGYNALRDNADTDDWVVAAETQYYLPRATISGVISYGETNDLDFNVWALDGEYRHFVTDNWSVSGGLSVGSAESFGNDFDAWGAGVGSEYQFASQPISVFASYRHSAYDGVVEQDNDTLSVGVRFNWGGETLRDRSQSGAGLERVSGPFERLFGSY